MLNRHYPMLVGAFNKVKALVEAFSMIVKNAGSFAALVHIYSINLYHR